MSKAATKTTASKGGKGTKASKGAAKGKGKGKAC